MRYVDPAIRAIWGFGLLSLVAVQPALAVPVPCAGGTIDIAATSDTPLAGLAYNVGQMATLAAVPAGITPASYAWTIPGPHVKDYSDDLGTKTTPVPASAFAWSTTPLAPADLTQPSVSLYWKPSPAQIDPLNGPPEPRVVSLTVTVGAASCTVSTTVTVERNLSDPTRQPEDYYTSTHRAPTTTNPGFGRVVDEHIYWHQFVGGGPVGNWRQFLAWHSYFVARFDIWRQEFGYPKVQPWYPGRPLPTGVAFDQTAALRLAFNPDNNRIPTWYTLAGSAAVDPSVPGVKRLADYATLDAFSNSFEGSYHGNTHCNIGASFPGQFFSSTGSGFGSMCLASSPKDPMFWRWHGFIDLMYRNYCALKGLACHVTPAPVSDPWMGDNAADIAAGGVPPSPGPHWMSPDIWNRTATVTADACIPRTAPPDVNTVGGVTRNCGSEADHENPAAGQPNFLYATLRNTGSKPVRNLYAEVAVYIANASTGLSWPVDFTMLPESRQFLTISLEPGQVTAIGPLPWTPPLPVPSDHWCIYIRVLSMQETPPVEDPVIDNNVANSNGLAWRNLKIVTTAQKTRISRFIVRNIRRDNQVLALEVAAAPELVKAGRLVFVLDAALQRALGDKPKLAGAKALGNGQFVLTEKRARFEGLRVPARGQGVAELRYEAPTTERATGDIIVTQRSRGEIDGGVTLRVAPAR